MKIFRKIDSSANIPMWQDLFRQWASVVLAIAQPIVTALTFGSGTDFNDKSGGSATSALIEPAPYTFVIWAFIYLGGIGFALYQAMPAQRRSPLLRRCGWGMASAFSSVCVWLLFARSGYVWVTVACILWMLVSLSIAFRELIRLGDSPTIQEHIFVFTPISLFLGWVSVATFANLAAALKSSGLLDLGWGEVGWTVILLLVAGSVGTIVIYRSSGNAVYALTVVWVLVGIIVADRTRAVSSAISPVASAMAVAVILALLLALRDKRIVYRDRDR